MDIDKAYRQRSQLMFIISKIGPITFLRRITYAVDVDETTHDLVDAYSKVHWLVYLFELFLSARRSEINSKLPFAKSRCIYRPSWYKYFDSFVDDFDYPMEDPYIAFCQLNDEQKASNSEELEKNEDSANDEQESSDSEELEKIEDSAS